MMQVSEIKVAFLDEILKDIGLSYNVESCRMSTPFYEQFIKGEGFKK